MRQFSIQLAQNLGTGALGATLDVTSARVDLGAWRWETDKELTKLSPGDLTVRLADVDGSIWTWLQTQIQSAAGLLPPFLTVDVDGGRAFLGTVDPSRMSQIQKTREISLTAQDWSAQLATKYLGADRPEDDADPAKNPWLRPYPKAASNRPTSEVHDGVAPIRTQLGVPGGLASLCFRSPANWVAVGDLLDGTTPLASLTGLKVLKVEHEVADRGYPPEFTTLVTVDRPVWPAFNSNNPFAWYSGTFTRRASTVSECNYYTITKAVGSNSETPCYVLDLDLVDGLNPGDQLRLIQGTRSQSWTLLQIDAATLQVTTKETVQDVTLGDRVFFTPDSLAEMVFEDARVILRRAAWPYTVDLSRYQPPTLPVPVLTWLPLRPIAGEDLTSLKDLDSGFTNLRVYGSGGTAWDGTPETGWQTAAGALPRAHWTDQLAASPSSLMPEEAATITPRAPRRHRATDPRWRRGVRPINDLSRERDDPEDPWNPDDAEIPDEAGVLVYDYLQMRRIQIAGTTATIAPWTGSTWGVGSVLAWPGGTVLSACVMPGVVNGILALTPTGLRVVTLPGGTATPALVVPTDAKDGVLRTTPWGAYLVGSKGYGRVTYASGALALAWVGLASQASQIYPNTFCGLNASECVALARFEAQDSQGQAHTETYALRLSTTPTTADAAVLWREKILEGSPRTLGALRDPSAPERVVGHCGGRLFQISHTLPIAYALERFKPSGMRASELIEHICQILHAVAFPGPDGVLHIVSRALLEAPFDLQIPNLSVQEARGWEHFYTLVRVSGDQEDIYADVPGPGEAAAQGGGFLEVSGHPLIWTLSGCEAMARALHAWFSVQRRVQKQTWVWADPDGPSPWEALPPLARIRLNGGATVWMMLSLEDRRTHGEAKVTLLEVG